MKLYERINFDLFILLYYDAKKQFELLRHFYLKNKQVTLLIIKQEKKGLIYETRFYYNLERLIKAKFLSSIW